MKKLKKMDESLSDTNKFRRDELLSYFCRMTKINYECCLGCGVKIPFGELCPLCKEEDKKNKKRYYIG